MWKLMVSTVLLGMSLVLFQSTWGCNEAICGSVVSKCLLTKSCNCDFKYDNCSCCKDCLNCLSFLYTECCSCVDMCPKPNSTNTPLSKQSHVEEFGTPVPALFSALTQDDDEAGQWTSISYPVDVVVPDLYNSKKELKLHMQSAEQEVLPMPKVITYNCTVAYWSKCMSWSKCKSSCSSMGASSYRWFHDSCCECVGTYCNQNGINESRCKECPVPEDEGPLPEENELDYGEDDEEYTYDTEDVN